GIEKKGKILKPQEKRSRSFLEAGHATVSCLLEHSSPLVKFTIVPRVRSLGAALYLPEEIQITSPSQLKDEMCSLLGGLAAEQVIFVYYSTVAQNDLE
ncbi:ATP-dependent zinc metalloprotease FtsH, partial [Ornithobacterium rhinotracheale]